MKAIVNKKITVPGFLMETQDPSNLVLLQSRLRLIYPWRGPFHVLHSSRRFVKYEVKVVLRGLGPLQEF